MSLQDDYFELDEELNGTQKKQLNRIWEAFCEMESEYDNLIRMKNLMRNAIRIAVSDDLTQPI
jgi:hypothetical protein